MPPSKAVLEHGRMKFFAKAIGEERDIYLDEKAAQRSGYPSILTPPTFLYCLGVEGFDMLGLMKEMGVDAFQLLHGEQSFLYEKNVFAGDLVVFNYEVADIEQKKNGAMELIHLVTSVFRNDVRVQTSKALYIVLHAPKDGGPE